MPSLHTTSGSADCTTTEHAAGEGKHLKGWQCPNILQYPKAPNHAHVPLCWSKDCRKELTCVCWELRE